MQSSPTRRARSLPATRAAQPHAVSGRHPRALAVPPRYEDFEEPLADLAALDDDEPLDPRELVRAHEILEEREQTIRGLEETLAALQADRARLLAELETRDSELAEIGALLIPALVEAPRPSLRRVSVSRVGDTDGFDVEFPDETALYADITADVARGGVFFATYREIPLGTRIGLELELEDGARLEATGVVSWHRSATCADSRPGVGVAFTSLSDAALECVSQVREFLYYEV